MYKSCPKCGRVHSTNGKCPFGSKFKRIIEDDEERKLRKTYLWQRKSVEIREKANYLCEVCKEQGEYKYDDLEVHHIIKIRQDKSKLLDDRNLICLCQFHHKMADAGEIPIDYLMDIADRRESER